MARSSSRRWVCRLALLLSGLLVVTSAPASLTGMPAPVAAWAAPGNGCADQRPDAVAAVATAKRCRQRVEVLARRSENAQVWALPDGGFFTEVFAGPVRFRRGATWSPIDLTLRVQADGSVAPIGHPFGLRLSGPAGAGEHALASMAVADDALSIAWTGNVPAPELSNNTATYREVWPGADLVVAATRTGFEQSLVVKHRAAVDAVASMRLSSRSDKLRFRADDAGGLTIQDRTGATVGRVPTPMARDARRGPVGEPTRQKPMGMRVSSRSAAKASGTAASHAAPESGTVDLALSLDPGWLNDPATVYPLTIDPAVEIHPASDTFVRDNMKSTDPGRYDLSGSNQLEIGKATNHLSRAFVRWPTAQFAGVTVRGATLRLWNFYSGSCIQGGWSAWTAAEFTVPIFWDTQPALLAHDGYSTQTAGFDSSCADRWIGMDVRSFFQRAADARSSQAHMALTAYDEVNVRSSWKQVRSLQAANNGEIPNVQVTYDVPPTVSDPHALPSTGGCVTGPGRPAVSSLTPRLRTTVTAGSGGPPSATFEWWVTGGDRIGQATVTPVASGAVAATSIPAGALREGGTYSWRVRAADGRSASAWSPWCEFTVYELAPPAPGCSGTAEGDTNGDGTRDTVIADPRAAVDGQRWAGVIHVVDGATGAVTTLHQNLAEIPDSAQAMDRFGGALAVYDANRDGCADVAVGAPYEDVDGAVDAGTVWVLFGSPAGLGKGPAAVTLRQGDGRLGETSEAGDWFGYSLAAGTTEAAEPYLLIGAPGDDINDAADAGAAHYLRGAASFTLSQDSPGVPGEPERDDWFGYAVSGSPDHLAIGAPGESINGAEWAGAVTIFTHQVEAASLRFAVDLHQDAPNVSHTAAADDQFGKAVALAPYRPAGVSGVNSLLAVGVPGADTTINGGVRLDSGRVFRFHLAGTGFSELPSITHESEDGDAFGERLVLVNTDPSAESTARNLLLAVGVPGEDRADTTDAGAVRVFAAADPFGSTTLVERGGGRLPGSPTAGELLGVAIGGSGQYLFVASPYRAGVVYALTWTSLAGGAVVPERTWQSGQGGFPAGGVSFGEVVR